ncbi:hypothetical protein FKV24_017255, partial [Lysobacter maris]
DEIEDAYPLSALQAGMVFHTQLEQFSGLYHDIVGQHVRCPWDAACFEQALASCVAEHPVLRTGFRLDGARPLQFVRREVALPLRVEDLRAMPEQEQEEHLASWTEAHKRHVFDWERGPLFQIHVFLRSDDSFHFVLSAHHSVLDGWSWAAFTTMLYNRYALRLSGQALVASAGNPGFRDFVALELEMLRDPDARAHFLAQLEGAPGQQLPRITRATEGPVAARRSSYEVGGFAALSSGLVGLARRLGVPIQSVALAGHYKVLSTLSGQPMAVSGVTHNGRPEQEGAEQALGLFLNSLPMAIDTSDCSWRELVARVVDVGARNMAYRAYPLARIQQDLGMTFEEVTFNYTHFHAYDALAASDSEQLQVLSLDVFEQTNYEFLVEVSRSIAGDDGLSLHLKYDAAVIDVDTVSRIGDYYLRAYAQMLADPESSHLAAPLLDESELTQLRDSRNATVVAYDARPVQQQIAEQAQRTPASPAVVCGDVTLS